MNSERFTQFPEHRQGETPLNLWERMYSHIPTPRNETYVSTPLTSGPTRLHVISREMNLTTEEITSRTLQSNQDFLDNIIEDFPHGAGGGVTFPHMVRNREDWKDLDFNKFWLYYLSGVSIRKANEFNEHIQKNNIIQDDIINNLSNIGDKRTDQYRKLINEFGDFVKNDSLNPVSRIVLMPGHEESVGCTFEKMVAEKLDISKEFVIFDRNNDRYPEKITKSAPWLDGHRQIKENGGQTLVYFSPSL